MEDVAVAAAAQAWCNSLHTHTYTHTAPQAVTSLINLAFWFNRTAAMSGWRRGGGCFNYTKKIWKQIGLKLSIVFPMNFIFLQ